MVPCVQGKFTAAQKKELFQLVAKNNTVRTDVISKLGILERQEAAWKNPDYNHVWEGERVRVVVCPCSCLGGSVRFGPSCMH